MVLLGVILLPSLQLALCLWCGQELRAYVRRTPAIESPADLDRFRAMVARQQYAALALILLTVAYLALLGYGIFTDQLGLLETMVPVFIFIIVGIMGHQFKAVERRAQNLPVPDEALRAERDRIVHAWLHRPFPE